MYFLNVLSDFVLCLQTEVAYFLGQCYHTDQILDFCNHVVSGQKKRVQTIKDLTELI